MGKAVPMASFRRATPDASAVSAFVELGDAPGDTPAPVQPSLSAPSLSAPIQPSLKAAASNEVEAVDLPDSRPSDATPREPILRPVEGFDGVPRGEPLRPKAAAKWRRKTLVRADGRELRKQTIYLDAELSHRLMVTCAQNQYELSEAIEEAVNFWLKKKQD
jgi:hypothetical protein